MAITTQDGTKLGVNVVTDIPIPSATTVANPNVELPPEKARVISHEMAILMNSAVVARPLGIPEVCSIHVKNTEYRYRWVNRDGMGGRFYVQRKTQGFLNATPNDVEILSGDAETKDGEIRAGDLILMKIRADLYDAHLKWNMQKARVLQNARGYYTEGGSSDPRSEATPTKHSVSDIGSKSAAAFIPGNADAIIDDSINSGRAEQTRAVVEELRTHGKESKGKKDN